MQKNPTFTIELRILTQGLDAHELARLLPFEASVIVNRGEKHPKGGLVPEYGIPQSGAISYVIEYNTRFTGDQQNSLSYEANFLTRFLGCSEVLKKMQAEFGCELEVVVRLYSVDTAPTLNFGVSFSEFLVEHAAILTFVVAL